MDVEYHMNKKFFSVLVSCIFLMPMVSVSEDLYFGAGAGYTHYHGLDKIDGVDSARENTFGSDAFIGYHFNKFFATELGYLYAGKGNTDGEKFENQGGTLSLIGRVPMIGDLSLFGEAGGYWAHSHGLEDKDSKVAPLFGLGLSYPISESFDLQARWRYTKDVNDLYSAASDSHFKGNQNMAMLELVYHPFRRKTVSPVIPVPPPVIEVLEPEPVIVEKIFNISSDVLFAFNKAELSSDGFNELDGVYEQLMNGHIKQIEAVVVGHSDRIGLDSVNLRISKQRAQVVADYLMDKGFAADKIKTVGYGSSDPITGDMCNKELSKAARIRCLAPDRRVEIRVHGIKTVTDLSVVDESDVR
ncbi:OmpA family protein [Shewanella algae]|uniref:OmpA family protein n=1 Tax=Shewanella algae TaxID=38313 RepID=UPI00197D429E|nr:OmpA family protein [Shewanella algae]